MATGLPVHRLETWDNTAPYDGSQARSWGHELVANGIRVATIGKLHFAGEDAPTGFPEQHIPMHVQSGRGGMRGLLRGNAPTAWEMREAVLDSGPGETEYTRYDRAIADRAVQWLEEIHASEVRPWALMVSFASPHHPLRAPNEFYRMYEDQAVPLPHDGEPELWSQHPAHVAQRRLQGHDRPFPRDDVQSAIRSYYSLVSFVDAQIGRVIAALEALGLFETTRIVYTADHGESLGNHGLWWKTSMYEESVGIPMIVAGPEIPRGLERSTPVSLTDIYPSVLENFGIRSPDDRLGASLWSLAATPSQLTRRVVSEYHGSFSSAAYYMLRAGQYKYIHYVDAPSQLFDLSTDPGESNDLGTHEASHGQIQELDAELRTILDPEEIDRLAKRYQDEQLRRHGGPEAVVSSAAGFSHTPPPVNFGADGGQPESRASSQRPADRKAPVRDED